MTTQPPYTQVVTQALTGANRPLTVAEILSRVEMVRPVDSRDPKATIRNAIGNVRRIVTLGGRPAHYTWWPRHLPESIFRQPLAASDLEAGTLALNEETRLALWPDFFVGPSRSHGGATLELAEGPTLQAQIQHLVSGQAVWGLPPTPPLAEWYRGVGAAPEDDLIVRVLDADARRYAVTLARRADRDEAAIAARNRALADVAEKALRASWGSLPEFDLAPRLIAHGAYCHPLPPDHWADALRSDLRFIVGHRELHLVEWLVNSLEREQEVPPDPHAWPCPPGDRRKLYPECEEGARFEEKRRAWGAYLFDRGMDHRWAGWDLAADAYYREALRLDPGHADAWVHLGNLRFDEGCLAEALNHYRRGQAAAEARTIGDPARYPGAFWGDVDSRPFMRALHGRALCLWRLGRPDEARRIFARMLELNPNDNQGARFLLHDLDEGLSWEESVARYEEQT